VHKTVTCRQ